MTLKEQGLLVLIIITGIFFRLALEYQNIGVSLDDTITVYVANAGTLSELIERIASHEYSPPLYFWIMQQWISIFGDKPSSISIPSMISGTVLVPAAFVFVKELFRKTNVALLAAFFAAVSPLTVFFSHEARLYSLFVVIMTFTFWAFVRVLRQSNRSRLIILSILATLLLYCHYIAIFIIGLLILSAIILVVLKKRDRSEANSTEWNFSLKQIVLTFMISGIAFLPWLPVFLRHRSAGTYWADPLPLTQWPFVFASNLAVTLPFPWIVGFCLVSIGVPLAIIVLIIRLAKKKIALASVFSVISFPWLFLALNLLVPASILGYVTPFIQGYCRYMVPFSVLSFSLLSAGAIFGAAKFHGKLSARLVKTSGALLLVAIAVLNFAELNVQFFGADRAGLRKVAMDVKNGKFPNSAFMITPDFDSSPFIYYLSREQGIGKPDTYYTFPRDGTIGPPEHAGYSEAWLAGDNVDKAVDWIAHLDKEKTPHLTVISDLAAQESKLMPAKSKAQELIGKIEKLYPRPAVSVYKGTGSSVEVYQFRLK